MPFQMLIMLAAGDDEDVAAIACYDIGEFVRNYPNGRVIAKRLGAKDVVMQLIENDNEELQRHALLCVSKMMVQNWAVRTIMCFEEALCEHICLTSTPYLTSFHRQYDDSPSELDATYRCGCTLYGSLALKKRENMNKGISKSNCNCFIN